MAGAAHWAARQRRRRRRARAARVCPITLRALPELAEPALASDGFVYERAALHAWAARSATSPLTRAPLQQWGVPLAVALRAAALG